MPEPAPEATESRDGQVALSLRSRVVAAVLIVAVAAANLAFFYSRGLTNLYGDGIAHMEGARRIFDSLTPGYAEIGSVWLPLFHLLVAPLALNDFLWRTGLGGSLVSTAATAGVAWWLFRLAGEINRGAAPGFLALAGVLFCPNFLYLASTPLTEPLALLWSVLTVYGLFRYRETGWLKILLGASLAAFLGTLTRYDEWYVLPFAALFVLLARRESWTLRFRHASLFSVIAGAGPALWIVHNAVRFKNPLEFYNGPFSARAIYAHQLATTAFPYPTDGNLLLSAHYFLEDLKLVIGPWPLVLAVLGLVAWAANPPLRERGAAALLFLVPLPFYLNALAYAAIPLYVPTLFPHTYYNLRYGLEMLPAIALLPSFIIPPSLSKRLRYGLFFIFAATIAFQGLSFSSRGVTELEVVKEGILNTPCRSQRQQAIIRFLRAQYNGGRVLVALGKWPCVMPQAGIYYHNTLSEANRMYWQKLSSEPEKWVEWIIRGDGDAVDELMRAYPQAFRDFVPAMSETFPGEGNVSIYRRRGQEQN
jgi:hypothetical protein